jgi:hypothetical protein
MVGTRADSLLLPQGFSGFPHAVVVTRLVILEHLGVEEMKGNRNHYPGSAVVQVNLVTHSDISVFLSEANHHQC